VGVGGRLIERGDHRGNWKDDNVGCWGRVRGVVLLVVGMIRSLGSQLGKGRGTGIGCRIGRGGRGENGQKGTVRVIGGDRIGRRSGEVGRGMVVMENWMC